MLHVLFRRNNHVLVVSIVISIGTWLTYLCLLVDGQCWSWEWHDLIRNICICWNPCAVKSKVEMWDVNLNRLPKQALIYLLFHNISDWEIFLASCQMIFCDQSPCCAVLCKAEHAESILSYAVLRGVCLLWNLCALSWEILAAVSNICSIDPGFFPNNWNLSLSSTWLELSMMQWYLFFLAYEEGFHILLFWCKIIDGCLP